jgi:uncharacterized phage protein (TIGR01671 family)
MREIRFRAWHKSKGIMRVVAHISNLLTVGTYVDVRMNEPDTITKIEEAWDEGDYILMQYTGLRDKNGKEIYEGDILSHKFFSRPVQVTFLRNGDYEELFYDVEADTGENIFEVIGNIYENPDLLNPPTPKDEL